MMPMRDLPIMEYVRTLENRIRKYQAEGVRIGWSMFWWGFLAGSIVISILWLGIRLKG